MEHILETNVALFHNLQNQMKSQRVMRLFEVEELYIGKLSLKQVPSLHCFPNLQALWLNGNKLMKVACLRDNLRLGDLYLHNNKLISITASLGQLTGLKTLLLHNNQLCKVEEIVQELKNMQGLQTLTLFNNPVSQEKNYREYVIFHLPSVKVLDRQEVTFHERMKAQRMFDTENQLVRDRLAFGSRAPEKASGDGESNVTLPQPPPPPPPPPAAGGTKGQEVSPADALEAAYERRRLLKTPVEFTHFDWSRVPRYEQRRQAESKDDFVASLQRTTVRYQV